jgi:S1-C subfamily serine protease
MTATQEPFPPPPPVPQPSPQAAQQKTKRKRSPALLIATIMLVSLVAGGLLGYSLSSLSLNGKIANLQNQVSTILLQDGAANSAQNDSYYVTSNVSIASLYQQVRPSVVVIEDLQPQYGGFFGRLIGYSQVQGSGFITDVNNREVIVTNYHVVENAINVTVIFTDGNAYAAQVLGTDPNADLAVLMINAMPSDLQPLQIASSSTLKVGDPVVAVGTPYGLQGSITAGIISAVGRTIVEDQSGGQVSIPSVIQTSTAINPGNSGGPLINYQGKIVGITTAAVSNSQGLGFAIPSNTILREITSLITSGSYNEHPSIDASGTDMTYEIAQAMGTNVTYGWLVESVSTQNGLKAGTNQVSIIGQTVTIGGDIIIAINGTRITNTDDLLSYLEENTLPQQTINATVVRGNQIQAVSVTIGKLS